MTLERDDVYAIQRAVSSALRGAQSTTRVDFTCGDDSVTMQLDHLPLVGDQVDVSSYWEPRVRVQGTILSRCWRTHDSDGWYLRVEVGGP